MQRLYRISFVCESRQRKWFQEGELFNVCLENVKQRAFLKIIFAAEGSEYYFFDTSSIE